MANIIEESKSSRATCRSCRQKIEKSALRFGEETPNAFDPEGGPAYAWHHLLCAAKKKPTEVKAALAAFTGTVPNREEVDAALASAKETTKPPFPYAERAPTGRSKCLVCEEGIEKGDLRVAIEREVDTGSFTAKSAGYLHATCAAQHDFGEEQDLFGKLKANSRGLAEPDLNELEQALQSGAEG